ncbi:MAG: 4Fe-4S binding protein [Melioribacteraceae bacterium]|nr:4Fe-4S binding protein [Melioribacteraceae bacterium]
MEKKDKFIRNKEKSIQQLRFTIQILFSILCIWIGVEFSQFIKFLETNGISGSDYRPPGVEGFLPISALMSVYYFFQSGIIHSVHPAGFFIFIAIVGVSLLFRKSFCSWLCPVGFISELVGDFGDKIAKKLFKRRIKIWKYLDYFFRSLKYLLLAFFAFSIFSMSQLALAYFLGGDYNIMADVKMYYFFANISQTALIVIGVLFLLSIIYRNFWCRYLCPYGALLGLLGFLSPTKIKRNTSTCIDCSLCAKACPSFIKVDKVITVNSDECTSCLNCVDVCPVENTLDLKLIGSDKKINKKFVAYGVVLIFIAITGLGMLTGNWQNKIPKELYIELHKNINNLGHPTSSSDIQKLNEESERNAK